MIFLLFLFTFFFSQDAYAYIDPGTGGIILQAIIGAIAATSLTIKIYWQKIKDFLKKKSNKRDPK
jgi:hypothetical protein|tara:strand:- start:1056 stop:1250 length:195 start_codon:yes stop_codon:yes gene_type:complete